MFSTRFSSKVVALLTFAVALALSFPSAVALAEEGPPGHVPPQPLPVPVPVERPADPQLPLKCDCKEVKWELRKLNVHAYLAKHETFWFTVKWTIDCNPGQIPDCRGEIRIKSTTAGAYLPENGYVKRIQCKGKTCAEQTTGSSDFRLRISRDLLKQKRATVRLQIESQCATGAVTKKVVTLAFTKGSYDRANSDLAGKEIV